MKRLLWALPLMGVLALSLAFRRELLWSWRYLHYAPPTVRVPAPLPTCLGCNLILVSLDTLRADRVGRRVDGQSLTPNLDRIRSRAYEFTRAYTNAFYTTPSHMTVFTSLYPNRHQVMGRGIRVQTAPRTPLDAPALSSQVQTLAEVLKQRDYRTLWAAPTDMKHLDPALGFTRGFDRIARPPFSHRLRLMENEKQGFQAEALADLKSLRQPFFAFVHAYTAHLPYFRDTPSARTPPWLTSVFLIQGALAKLSEDPERILGPNPNGGRWPEHIVRICADARTMATCLQHVPRSQLATTIGQYQLSLMERERPSRKAQLRAEIERAYDENVRELDRQIGEFWAYLEAQGLLKTTMVLFFADHGEDLFEQEHGGHAGFYETSARVPLILYHPEATQPSPSAEVIGLIDVMPMMLNLLGLKAPEQVQGRGLLDPPREFVFGYALGSDYVFDGEWKLARDFKGVERLHFLPLDPEERVNLLRSPLPWPQRAYAKLERARSDWEKEQALAPAD